MCYAPGFCRSAGADLARKALESSTMALAISPTASQGACGMLLEPLREIESSGEMPGHEVTAQIAAESHRILDVDPEELYARLTPAVCCRTPHLALQWLRDAGLLQHILPELDATVDFSQEGDRRHKDVWEHTKQVVRQAVPRPTVRWAAVLHDIGKVTTRRFLPDGKVTFHGHSEAGVRMFRRGPSKRIAFPSDVRLVVEQLILFHLRPGQYDGSWTDSAVRRFRREVEPVLVDLLDLGRADVTSKRPGKRARCLRMIRDLADRIDALDEEDAKPKPLPPGLGTTLMAGLKLPPGKHIGELRQRLEQMFEAGTVQGGREADYYLDIVREHELLKGLKIQPPRGFPDAG